MTNLVTYVKEQKDVCNMCRYYENLYTSVTLV